MPPSTPHTAVLMIRVWLSDGEPGLLRARLTEILELVSPARTYAVVADADGIVSATVEWLNKIQAGDTD